jgi:hypothetical protein
MKDFTQKFLEIRTELENENPITLNLSVAETFGIISILQLARITMPGVDSYLKTLRKRFNENDVLEKLRNLKDITITISALEGFYIMLVTKLIKADDPENNITVTLADEAGEKIIKVLAKDI